MSDILDGLAQIRLVFKREHLEPPTVLHLGSHDEGMRFLSNVRQSPYWVTTLGDPNLGKTVELSDGSIYMQIELMGFKIRWPANRVATPDGRWGYM